MTWGRWLVGPRSFDLVGAAVVAGAAAGLTLLGASHTARTMAALPLVLALPGYALSVAAFPGRALGAAERIAFSFGVSLAVAALGGLLLNWTPWGLQATSWALLLSGVTLGASAVGVLRRRGRPVADPDRPGTEFNRRQGLLLGLAALVVTGAVGVAHAGATHHRTAGFTQLWILPADRAGQNAVRLGVSNSELEGSTYRLQLVVEDRAVLEWPSLRLGPGGQWETTVVLPTGQAGAGTVDAVLYRLDAPGSAYRRVVLWPGQPTE
jgi:uncharacterized membrane protein